MPPILHVPKAPPNLNTLVTRYGTNFGVLRVSDPANMSLVGSLSSMRTTDQRASIQWHEAKELLFDYSRLTTPERVEQIDIADPTAPSVLREDVQLSLMRGFQIIPDRNLMIAVTITDTLYCYDISDRTNITLSGSVLLQDGGDTSTRIQDAWDVAYDPVSQHAIVCDLSATGRIGIVDISDPYNLSFVDTLADSDVAQTYTVTVDPTSEYAYGSSTVSGTGYLYSVDCSTPNTLAMGDRLIVPDWLNMWAFDIYPAGSLLFGFNVGGTTIPHVFVFDISDPLNLSLIATITDSEIKNCYGGRYDPLEQVLFTQGQNAAGSKDAVASYDLSDLTNITQIQFFEWN